MTRILNKPCSETERIDFICEANNEGLLIFETDEYLRIIEVDEMLVEGQVIKNPDYEAEQVQTRQKQFETEFFNTSLGYIRRKVTMANGDTKDFLTDLLPSIAMGTQLNQPVSVITYIEPDFTEEITDWVKYQEVKLATAEFIQECFMQLNNDFMPQKEPITESEEE